jgi:hypothetical protein
VSALEVFMQQSRYLERQRRRAWRSVFQLVGVAALSTAGSWLLWAALPGPCAVLLAGLGSVVVVCHRAR